MNAHGSKNIIALIGIGVLLLAAFPATAAIVPDECRLGASSNVAQTCTICHLGVLVTNLTNFLIEKVAFPAAALLIAVSGLILLSSGGSEERQKLGKNIFSKAVMGIIIVLLAWVIVDTTIKVLTGSVSRSNFFGVFGPWNRAVIDCKI